MADDLAWDDDDFEPEIQVLAGDVKEAEEDKFAGEDEEVEEKVVKKKPARSKKVERERAASAVNQSAAPGEELDPIAEKIRRLKLQQASDLANAADLFGTDKDLETLAPTEELEYEELGALAAYKYFLKFERDEYYTSSIKQFLRTSLSELSSADIKLVESTIVALRNEALKKEKEKNGKSKKAKKKEQLNAGKGGGSAGLDDYMYDDPMDDEYDFM